MSGNNKLEDVIGGPTLGTCVHMNKVNSLNSDFHRIALDLVQLTKLDQSFLLLYFQHHILINHENNVQMIRMGF